MTSPPPSSGSLRRAALGLLPGSWLAALRTARRLAPAPRRTWLRLAALRLLGLRPLRAEGPRGDGPVLFICHGNIMRSAMAAALFLRYSADNGVARGAVSAGLHAVPGKRADPRARAAAADFEVSLEEHRAQPVTAGLLQEAGLIVVMDRLNEAELLARFPDAADRTVSLAAYLPPSRPPIREITDPYMAEETEVRACFDLVDRAVRSLCDRLGGSSR